VLERRDRHLDHTDRQTITRALNLARPLAADDGTGDFSCEHLQPHQEPALWIPDAVAWSHGAGGVWRARVSPLVECVVDLGQVRR
jgi:hypothetical protein